MPLSDAVAAAGTRRPTAAARWPCCSRTCRPPPVLRRPGRGASALAGDRSLAFVPDAEGTGTVLLAAAARRPAPAFGAGSAARHEPARRRPAGPGPATLRRDVDTWAALAQALDLGAGPATTAAITHRRGLDRWLGWPCAGLRPLLRPGDPCWAGVVTR